MYIINLKDVSKNDVNIAGGKGANLGELIQNNVQVPEGFVVNTYAYDKYLKYNGVDTIINQISSRAYEGGYDSLRKLISNGKFPSEMLKEIKEAYSRLEERSSATAEDLSDASFAGQQETYLNVRGLEAVLQRIKDCFASCFSDRSLEYRKKSGYDKNDVKSAVVVQSMIESECAGVMFTANVLNGNVKEMLINSSYGLGEAVVSGLVNPDQFTLNKKGQVLSKNLGRKEEKIIYDKNETIKIKVNVEEQSKWSIDNKDLNKLCEIGNNIEKLYGKPMDIEWAKKDWNIYVLQARAITTLSENITPETGKYNECKIKVSKMAKKNLAFTLEHAPYAYYPLDYDISMILADEKIKLFYELGVKSSNSFKIDDNGVIKFINGKVGLNRNILHILRSLKEYTNIEDNNKKGKLILEKCSEKLNLIETESLQDKSLKECRHLLDNLAEIQKNIAFARFKYFIFPSVIIGKKLNKYLKGTSNYSEYDMLSNLKYRTWQINEDLKRLSQDIKYYNKDNLEAYNEYKEEKIEEYLKKHGYKSDFNCYPFSAKSWNEDRDSFERLLNVTMKSSHEEVNNDKYNDVIETIRKNSGKKQKDILKKVEYYRECHVYREESQYLWEKCYAMMRKVLARISYSLNIDIKELWYLRFSELLDICDKGILDDKDYKKINNRKNYRREAENYWGYIQSLVAGADNSTNTFDGVIGSSGIKQGTACVVLGKEDFYKLKKGDILICNSTSPEWTPLFSLASAVVSNTGGALSHAAIVAREYGIPAVLGTGNATTKIHDGDIVCVDGTKGRVILLNEK